ncbi:MAG: OmpA family protein [Alphaproteobacteria bacterium]|nr:OmpA family protein [Alphaproteobacteria bacterium]
MRPALSIVAAMAVSVTGCESPPPPLRSHGSDRCSTAVPFAPGSAALSSDAIYVINRIATNCFDGFLDSSQSNAFVVGYADKTGSPEANLRLSRKRAEAVCEYLISTGLPRQKLRVHWFGDRLGQKEGSDAYSRRVDIFRQNPDQEYLRDYKEC